MFRCFTRGRVVRAFKRPHLRVLRPRGYAPRAFLLFRHGPRKGRLMVPMLWEPMSHEAGEAGGRNAIDERRAAIASDVAGKHRARAPRSVRRPATPGRARAHAGARTKDADRNSCSMPSPQHRGGQGRGDPRRRAQHPIVPFIRGRISVWGPEQWDSAMRHKRYDPIGSCGGARKW